jgi:hypothetical protein
MTAKVLKFLFYKQITIVIMENLMVIRVEVIAPEPLDANTSSKNIAYADFTVCKRPKISSVLIWPVAISKNTLC